MNFIDASEIHLSKNEKSICNDCLSHFRWDFSSDCIFCAVLLPINNICTRAFMWNGKWKFIRNSVLLDHTPSMYKFLAFRILRSILFKLEEEIMNKIDIYCHVYSWSVASTRNGINRAASQPASHPVNQLVLHMLYMRWIQNCVKLYLLGKVLDVFWCDNGMTINFQ